MKKFIFLAAFLTTLLCPDTMAKGKIQNEDIKSLSELVSAGGSMSQLPNDTKIYVTANGINTQLSTAIQSGVIGGGGGSSGVNVLQNPGFEVGLTSYSHSGGTFVSVNAGSNLLIGQGSATFQASGTGQYFISNSYAIPNGLKGTSCAVGVLYKGGDANLTLQAYDGSNVLASAVLNPVPGPTIQYATFVCPSSGNFQLKVISSGASALTSFDQLFLGQNTLISTSQATYFGGVTPVAGCALTTSATSIGPMSQVSSTCVGGTVQGNITSYNPSDGSWTVTNMPPGEYEITVSATCARSSASTNDMYFALTDNGTFTTPNFTLGSSVSGTLRSPCVLRQHVTYNTASNRTFNILGAASSSDITQVYWGGNQSENISIYRFPSQSEQAVRPETINWNVGFNETWGDASLGTSAVVSNTPIAGGAFYGVNTAPGTIHALTPCSGTDTPVDGVACPTASEIGVSYPQPAAGLVKVCVNFQSYASLAANTNIQNTFVISQTANNNDSSFLQTATNVASVDYTSGTGGTNYGQQNVLCSNFNLASSGLTTFRLLYRQDSTGGTIAGNVVLADGGLSGRTIYWTVTPITQDVPAPVFVGSVTSPSAGVEIVARAHIASCTSDPCTISSQSGSWLSVVNRTGTGAYTAHYSGVWSSAPSCSFTTGFGAAAYSAFPTTTSFGLNTYTPTSPALTDSGFDIVCVGPQ